MILHVEGGPPPPGFVMGPVLTYNLPEYPQQLLSHPQQTQLEPQFASQQPSTTVVHVSPVSAPRVVITDGCPGCRVNKDETLE